MPGELANVYLAKLAEQAERFEDMVAQMKKVVEIRGGAIEMEERNILSVAFKNVVGTRRASMRTITTLEDKLMKEKGADPTKLDACIKYRKAVQKELQEECASVIAILDNSLIGKAEDAEAKTFYLKMRADYYRYRSEFAESNEKADFAEKAMNSYEEAERSATESLATTHPIRLGLALNQSVFLYEVKQMEEEACDLAKKAFDAAIAEVDTLDDDTYKDSTLIMQLIRDNLTLWKPEK